MPGKGKTWGRTWGTQGRLEVEDPRTAQVYDLKAEVNLTTERRMGG